MAREVNFDKLIEVNKLNEGDMVKLTNGDVAEFVRLKQKNFVGIMNGKSYNIPVNMFVSVESKVDLKSKAKEQEQEYKSLKQNELFYINHKGNAVLFKFNEIKGGKIIGVNPSTNATTRIDTSLFGGKVSSL